MNIIKISNINEITKIKLDKINKNIAFWGCKIPHSNLDILYDIYKMFIGKDDINCIFIIKSNAINDFKKSLFSFIGNIYVIDDSYIIENITNLYLLITNDYVPGSDGLINTNCKILFLPHNSNAIVPTFFGFYGDYNLFIKFIPEYLHDYSDVPSSLLYHGCNKNNKYMITGFNPKIEKIYTEYIKLNTSHRDKYIIFYPSLLMCFYNNEKMINLFFSNTLELFLFFKKRYPNLKFVLRPFPSDINNKHFIILKNILLSYDNFIYDDTNDNIYYLIRSKYIITDYSSIEGNCNYGVLKPLIRYKINGGEFCFKDNSGYNCVNIAQIKDAIEDIDVTFTQWQKCFINQKKVIFPDKFSTFNVINEIINHMPNENWTLFKVNGCEICSLKCAILFVSRLKNTIFYRKCCPSILYRWLNHYFKSTKIDILFLNLLYSCYDEIVNNKKFSWIILFVDQTISTIEHRLPNFIKIKYHKYMLKHFINNMAVIKFILK